MLLPSGVWCCRKMLEQSTAALCPSVAYHLTGAKKVQQDLATSDTLERFLSADEASLMRRCFAGTPPSHLMARPPGPVLCRQ